MKTLQRILGLTCLIATLMMGTAAFGNERPLVRGEDRVDVPEIRDGLSVHNLFQSNMVIQRDKPVSVWGWAAPGERISVSFAGQTQAATAAGDGSWKVTLSAMPVNTEAQQMTVKGNHETLTLENILLGDIWVLGGQSNMEFALAKLDHGDLEIDSANFGNIRLLKIPLRHGPDEKKSFPSLYQWSDWSKRHFRQGYWDVGSPETVRDFSGLGYIFVRRLHMATQIPIGVIDASRGGATLETYTPDAVLRRLDTPEVKAMLDEWDTRVREYDPQKDLENRVTRHHEWVERMKKEERPIPPDRTVPTDLQPGPAMDMNRPGNCYAGIIAPLAGMSVKGAIWHQGYNNALQPNGHVPYAQIFPEMIKAWRDAFNDPAMPFGIISLCTAGAPQDLDNYVRSMLDEGVFIRAAQYQTFLNLQQAGDTNIGFASSYDQRRSWYHPQIKVPVGERIARWALATQYGRRIQWEPPRYTGMEIVDGKIHLSISANLAPYHDGPILGFAIAGADGRFQPAQAEFFVTGVDNRNRPRHDRNRIVLSSPLIPEPLHFRYAWSRNPLATLKTSNHTDIPFATQRSDTWTLADMYEAYTGKKPEGVAMNRQQNGELRKALQDEDLRRRLFEAKQLIREHDKKEAAE